MGQVRFAIVTSVFNGAQFLDEAILSVLTQAGDFAIHYHVQDGRSTDGTLDKLARWKARLADNFPILCRSVEFSYASEADRGVYDGINRGFVRCGDADVMSWINADDRFEPGAFQLAAHIFQRHDDVHWLCGRGGEIDERGTPLPPPDILPLFPRDAVAAGLFDNRVLPRFVQQEGTFWRSWLWRESGGVNADFRLAGDFDLWCRFGRHAELVTVDSVLGRFRRRQGQLSANLTAYSREVDQSIAGLDPQQRREVAQDLRLSPRTARVVTWRGGEWCLWSNAQQLRSRAFLSAVWALREHLPKTFSIRARLRRISFW